MIHAQLLFDPSPKLSYRVKKIEQYIARFVQALYLCQNTVFDDSGDVSDGSDFMEKELNRI